MDKQNISLSVIVTAHSEGILLHKTLKSIDRAAQILKDRGFTYEVIVHIDSATSNMKAYLSANKSYLDQFIVYENSYKDAGASRNFCVSKAAGTFVTFIDGDDLVSKNWLADALQYLVTNKKQDIVAHPALTVEFDATTNIVTKHGDIDRATDTLLSVFANRWNVVLMTKRTLLQKHPYVVDPEGYGFEDWNLNNQFIYAGYSNLLIPESVIFVRRKVTDSRWAAQKGAHSIVRRSKLLGFEHTRSITIPDGTSNSHVPHNPVRLSAVNSAKKLLQRQPYLYGKIRQYYLRLKDGVEALPSKTPAADWLLEEWKDIHAIEKKLFPSELVLASTRTYDSITPAHWEVGLGYKRIVDAMKHNSYDYLLFAPWVSKGGADKFVISYANQIQAINPKKRVLVIATLPVESVWKNRLRCDFLPFGQLTEHLHPDLQMRILEQLVENSGAQHLHIINSALAYEFAATHQAYMCNSGKRLVATSFSQSTDESGQIFGYSHTHLPDIYELCDFVTSDNKAVLNMWQREYGFDINKVLLHRPLIDLPRKTASTTTVGQEDSLRVLWAARLAPEKIPQVAVEVGRLLKDNNVNIDMYGGVDDGFDTSFLEKLPSNVVYKGSYDGPANLPMDKYDAFLYTSIFDGIPNILAEVGAAGLPIVASKAGGIPEIIINNQTGILIDNPNEAKSYAKSLLLLKQDSDLRKRLVDTMRKQLEDEYSEKTYTQRVTSMLKELDYL